MFTEKNIDKYSALAYNFESVYYTKRPKDDRTVEIIQGLPHVHFVVECMMKRHRSYIPDGNISNRMACILNKEKVSVYYVDIDDDYEDVVKFIEKDDSIYYILWFKGRDSRDKSVFVDLFELNGYQALDSGLASWFMIYYKKN